jgi:hypothetical protein
MESFVSYRARQVLTSKRNGQKYQDAFAGTLACCYVGQANDLTAASLVM